MNYKDERAHDEILIELVKDLDANGNLIPIQTALNVSSHLGKLQRACRRKAFDIELTFSNASILIETKVDSDEGGRWNGSWQTESIYENVQLLSYLKSEKYFIFVTYGTSEFYTKPFLPGPASKHFIHLGLDKMITFVSSSLSVLSAPVKSRYEEWLNFMHIEQEKRRNSLSLLAEFEKFRNSYLSIHQDIDFPHNRLSICAPELAFPLFGQIAQLWNSSPEYFEPFGRVSVYPVGRLSPAVHDSILNFSELWNKGIPKLGASIESHGNLYFEINEDFNLNLKLDASTLDQSLRNIVHQRLTNQTWPPGVSARPRQYKQATYVLYEWDFGLLKKLRNLPDALSNLAQILSDALTTLA